MDLTVVIMGLGGVGLSAIMGAKIVGYGISCRCNKRLAMLTLYAVAVPLLALTALNLVSSSPRSLVLLTS